MAYALRHEDDHTPLLQDSQDATYGGLHNQALDIRILFVGRNKQQHITGLGTNAIDARNRYDVALRILIADTTAVYPRTITIVARAAQHFAATTSRFGPQRMNPMIPDQEVLAHRGAQPYTKERTFVIAGTHKCVEGTNFPDGHPQSVFSQATRSSISASVSAASPVIFSGEWGPARRSWIDRARALWSQRVFR